MNAAGDEDRVTPSFGEHLLLPGWAGWRRRGWGRAGTAGEGTDEAELHDHGNGAGSVVGSGELKLNIDGDEPVGAVVDVTGDVFCDDGNVAVRGVLGGSDLPADSGSVFGDAAVDLAVEVLDDLWAAGKGLALDLS